MITDDRSFEQTAMTFYNNYECNNYEEFEKDIGKIILIRNLFMKYDERGDTNFQLLMNHFIGFANCFGIISEQMLKFKLKKHRNKINALFVLTGAKSFNGTFEIDENFFIALRHNLKRE